MKKHLEMNFARRNASGTIPFRPPTMVGINCVLVLVATLLLFASDPTGFAADTAAPLKPIRGEVIDRKFLAPEVLSEGLLLQDAARMTHCDFLWNLVWLELD